MIAKCDADAGTAYHIAQGKVMKMAEQSKTCGREVYSQHLPGAASIIR